MNSPKHRKMTLHGAIIKVLREKKCEMTRREIADEINRRKLYSRKDGSDVPASQISARISKPHYSHLFIRQAFYIGLR
jgi:hypothetical protein